METDMKVLLEKLNSIQEIMEVKFENVNHEIKAVRDDLKTIQKKHDADLVKVEENVNKLDKRADKNDNKWSWAYGLGAFVTVAFTAFILLAPFLFNGWLYDALRGDTAKHIVIQIVEDEFFITE